VSSSCPTELLRNLGRLQALFPPGFNVAAECLRAGIEKIELASTGVYSKSPGMYCAEGKTIRLDPDLTDHDRAQLARKINHRHRGLGVTSEDVFVFVVLHELGHHVRRRNLLAMDRRNMLGGGLGLAEGETICMEEHEAEQFAMRRFVEWKKGRRC
jgi:hypothetical protein